MKYIPAASFTPASRTKADIRLIVIHTMEMGEYDGTAESCAAYFHRTPGASAHYCIDNDSEVQCVKVHDVAWCAPFTNHDGIHLEHAGRASQGPRSWNDQYSTKMLKRSARLAARLAIANDIPIRHLTVAELKAGKSGFIGHVDSTKAYGPYGGHTDPGESFPWTKYLDLVSKQVRLLTGVTPPTPSTPSTPTKPVQPEDLEPDMTATIIKTKGGQGAHLLAVGNQVEKLPAGYSYSTPEDPNPGALPVIITLDAGDDGERFLKA